MLKDILKTTAKKTGKGALFGAALGTSFGLGVIYTVHVFNDYKPRVRKR